MSFMVIMETYWKMICSKNRGFRTCNHNTFCLQLFNRAWSRTVSAVCTLLASYFVCVILSLYMSIGCKLHKVMPKISKQGKDQSTYCRMNDFQTSFVCINFQIIPSRKIHFRACHIFNKLTYKLFMKVCMFVPFNTSPYIWDTRLEAQIN